MAELSRQLGRRSDPVSGAILKRLIEGLEGADHFVGDVRDDFLEVLDLTIRFVRHHYDIERREASPQLAYLFWHTGEGDPPLEEALARDYHAHLQIFTMQSRARHEVRGIGTGRVDVLIAYGTHEFSAEIKRELRGASREGLGRYLRQAASYPASGVRLGLLIVLDLTPKPDGVEAVEALMYVDIVPGVSTDDLPRHIVVAKVPSNRPVPSDLSR
jgi:hypothetical protein